MPPDHNSVEITVRDVWDQLHSMRKDMADQLRDVGKDVTETKQSVSNMETKLDSVIARGDDHEIRIRVVEKLTEVLRNLPERVTSLERKVWALPSAAIIIAVITLAVAIINAFKKG
jgi:hypothetical protein